MFALFLLQFLSGTKALRDSKSISPEEKVQDRGIKWHQNIMLFEVDIKCLSVTVISTK